LLLALLFGLGCIAILVIELLVGCPLPGVVFVLLVVLPYLLLLGCLCVCRVFCMGWFVFDFFVVCRLWLVVPRVYLSRVYGTRCIFLVFLYLLGSRLLLVLLSCHCCLHLLLYILYLLVLLGGKCPVLGV